MADPILTIPERDREDYLKRALKAADWFVNQQIKCNWPWQSDHGRYMYYYYIPEKKYVPGLNWTHGRALFVLTEAYTLTHDEKYLQSMELAMRYVRALQPLDPYYQTSYGVIHEEIPQSPIGGILDGAQAASGMLMYYTVTGEADYLRRGKAFCDFLLRTWRADLGMPSACYFSPEKVKYIPVPDNAIHQASAIPLWHLYTLTGEGQYVKLLVDAADRVLNCQRPDGALNYVSDISTVDEIVFNHHWGLGEGDDRFILRNDDGIVTVVLAAYKITGDEKYLDAMIRYADWLIENEPHERPFNAFGIQAANVLDIGKVAGKDYTPWVLEHLDKHCLSLQVDGTGDPKADGGFCGEDEEGDSGIFGGTAKDYVPTRNTCYMAGLLFRLSGKGTGSGFSVFGLPKQETAASGSDPKSFFEEQL